MSEPIRISQRDLSAPEVDEYIEIQQYLRRDVGDLQEQPWIIKVIYANWFYLAVCCMVGGLLGWMIIEPFFDDLQQDEDSVDLAGILLFPVSAGCIGLFLGASEGIMCRNPLRAVISGAVGLGVGFVGAFIALFPAGIVFAIASSVAFSLMPEDQIGMPTGIAFLVLMMGRGVAWCLASIPAGIGQGIALKERKIIINGLVGAVLGGLIGGLLFDPISVIFETDDGQANASRAVGLATIGLMVGLFVGLVEGWTKTAWLLMKKGPLAGKQFILYKDTTALGSSPKADIYLFKDDAIEPRHALIVNRGGRFEIQDCDSPDGTYVNGIPISTHILQQGDQVIVGKTVLEFSIKEKTW
ncbi:MAG: FHA domain-containing protein [Planctomycetaceae bacterium]